MGKTAQQIVEAMLDGTPAVPMVPIHLPRLIQAGPLDPRWNTQDIALEYMEGEIGRHDWRRNWQEHKRLHGDKLKERIAEWLKHFEIDHDPQGLISYIDDELSMNPGKWL